MIPTPLRGVVVIVIGVGCPWLRLRFPAALLLLMAFALELGFQVYNDLAIMKGATPPFDLAGTIDAVVLHPWTEGF